MKALGILLAAAADTAADTASAGKADSTSGRQAPPLTATAGQNATDIAVGGKADSTPGLLNGAAMPEQQGPRLAATAGEKAADLSISAPGLYQDTVTSGQDSTLHIVTPERDAAPKEAVSDDAVAPPGGNAVAGCRLLLHCSVVSALWAAAARRILLQVHSYSQSSESKSQSVLSTTLQMERASWQHIQNCI